MMDFKPNPQQSYEENIKDFEAHLKKRRFKEIFIGVLSPFYPIAWLVDLPIRRNHKKWGINKMKKQLADPIYIIDWEKDKATVYLEEAKSDRDEIENIKADLEDSSKENTNNLLGVGGAKIIRKQEQEIQQKLLLQQIKIEFFEKYVNSLSLIKSYYQTEAKLAGIQTSHHDIIDMLLYKQKSDEMESGQFVNLRTLSSEMAHCQEQDKAEILMEILNDKENLA